MFEKFNPDARAVVIAAESEARNLDSNHIGTEHLLLAVVAAMPDVCAAVGLTRQHVIDGLYDEDGHAPAESIPLTPRALRALVLAAAADVVAPVDILRGLLEEGIEWDAGGQAGPQHLLGALERCGTDAATLRAAVRE